MQYLYINIIVITETHIRSTYINMMVIYSTDINIIVICSAETQFKSHTVEINKSITTIKHFVEMIYGIAIDLASISGRVWLP